MKYLIYTDGACDHKNRKAASSYFIKTKDDFITLGFKSFSGKSAVIAEILAIGLAVETIMKEVELKSVDKVVIYTDSSRALEIFSTLKEENSELEVGGPRVQLAWDVCKKLNTICDVEIRKIKAHSDATNGNKVADRLAKHALRLSTSR